MRHVDGGAAACLPPRGDVPVRQPYTRGSRNKNRADFMFGWRHRQRHQGGASWALRGNDRRAEAGAAEADPLDIAPRGGVARFSAIRGVPRMSHRSFEKSWIQISGCVFIRSEGCAHCSRPSLDRTAGQVLSSLSGRRQSGTRATEACRGDPHCLHRGCEPRAHRSRCIDKWRIVAASCRLDCRLLVAVARSRVGWFGTAH